MCILFDGPVHQQTSSVLRGRLQISHGSGGKWPQQPIGTADAPPAPQTRAWRYGGWKKNPPASSDMAIENPYKWVHIWIWIGGQCRCLCIFHVEIIYKIMTNDDKWEVFRHASARHVSFPESNRSKIIAVQKHVWESMSNKGQLADASCGSWLLLVENTRNLIAFEICVSSTLVGNDAAFMVRTSLYGGF